MPLHRDSEGISPDIAALRRGPRAERAVDDATRDPRPDQAVQPRAGCALAEPLVMDAGGLALAESSLRW